jgi:glucose/arabinose dehydrogenase
LFSSLLDFKLMKRLSIAGLLAIAIAIIASVRGAAQPAGKLICDPDNGGITLPKGFCAIVVADGVGYARHMAIAPNGDVYVGLRNRQTEKGAIVALRDTNGDGKADVRERFGDDGGTGIALRNGFLYFTRGDSSVVRYRMKPGQLVPETTAEVIVELPVQRAHAGKGITFDGKGGLYVNVGAPSNACQQDDRKPKSPGQDPCPLLEQHGGIWRFDENKPGQKQMEDGTRYATGLRQMLALAWNPTANALFLVQHGRDMLDTTWPGQFTAEQNAELPSEEFLRIDQGSNHGWPYCYHDWQQGKRVLMPEYGGDGKKTDRCEKYPAPLVAFPGHWAPNGLMFYGGKQLPQRYRGGAFIAFHGSWNRAPLPQAGYNVAFVPFSGGKVSGKYEVFADGFMGPKPPAKPEEATYRPSAVAEGPDGSIYISESAKGRIWKVIFRGT